MIIAMLLTTTLLASCGKNGEITKSDDPGILPEIDAPIDEDESESPPNIEITNNLECPDCPSAICCSDAPATCCSDDTTIASDCADDPTSADPTDNLPDDPVDPPFDFTFVPTILFEPIHLPFFDSTDPDEKDTLYNDSDYPETCLDISDTDTHWWLAYLLTGGILSQIEFDEIDYISQETENDYSSHKEMALPGEEILTLEMDYTLGKPQLSDTALSFIPDNYSLTYYYLTYDDPVLGTVTIDGSLTCEGETHYYAETEGWHRHHNCISTDDHFIIFIKGTKYILDFDLIRQFNGIEFFLAGHTFPEGELIINNVKYDIEKTLPMSVSLCLRFSGTEDSRE